MGLRIMIFNWTLFSVFYAGHLGPTRCVLLAFALLIILSVYESGNAKKLTVFGHMYKSTKDNLKQGQAIERRSSYENSRQTFSYLQQENISYKYLTKANLTKMAKTAENKPNTKPEVRHIAFLKVHKAASTTVQNILFRFGHRRGLNFVLSKKGHYFSRSTKRHKSLIPPKQNGTYDILCNHGYFNYSTYSSVLPSDTIYIAIVREPWSQFVSAFNYYLSVHHLQYLVNIPENKLENLVLFPEKYEKGSFSNTQNSMARDFGFTLKHLHRSKPQNLSKSTKNYLHKLGFIFDFVMIKEFFDESLIILKKRLGWPLKDILYISKNVHRSGEKINKEKLIDKFRKRNFLDFAIYDFFLEKFKEEKERYGKALNAETDNFRTVLKRVQNLCFDKHHDEMLIDSTMWNEQFVVTLSDCSLMAKSELKFINLLKKEVTTNGKF